MSHFSLTDAMGHEVNAELLATLMVGGLRNARRLVDDAGSMCLDWHGGPTRDRTSNSGADH